ncbi:uncharacterized protein NPIL_314251, partial [Nephila pilipes]
CFKERNKVNLYDVIIRPTLSAHVCKTSDPPDYLRQLAPELINSNTPDDANLVYTEGSRNEMPYSSNGIDIRFQDNSCQFTVRNPDGCSDFAVNLLLSIQPATRSSHFPIRVAYGFLRTVLVPSLTFLIATEWEIILEWLFWKI